MIWIGTYDGGLEQIQGRQVYQLSHGMSGFSIMAFSRFWKMSARNIWMSCNRGIYRISKLELNDFADGNIRWIHSVSYGKEDGMLSTECNGGHQPAGIKARDGKFCLERRMAWR